VTCVIQNPQQLSAASVDRQTDTQTDATENITAPHSRVIETFLVRSLQNESALHSC